jgi:hypothetical protein
MEVDINRIPLWNSTTCESQGVPDSEKLPVAPPAFGLAVDRSLIASISITPSGFLSKGRTLSGDPGRTATMSLFNKFKGF